MKVIPAIMLATLVLACATPVLDRQFAEKAFLNVPLASMAEYPLLYKSDLFLLGGLIIDAKQSERGIVIEALYIPVNRRGYIKDQKLAEGTYLALLPGNGPGIDELTYRPGTYISIAAEFVGTDTSVRNREIYPLFSVRDIHVWGDEYVHAFNLPPGQPGRLNEDRSIDPWSAWKNPLSP